MYFHLIWIKEKNWKNYDLDVLLQWWDEDFVRKFLASRWVVIVSIVEYKEDPKSFWNIIVFTRYENVDISMLIKWKDIKESTHFFVFLWLDISNINYVNEPLSDAQVKEVIDSTISEINEENEVFKKKQELAELNEQKKYEESWIKDWLKILNSNIDCIEQVMKAGEWILSWMDMKQLENYLNEMKRIRLGTNFNKMASIVLDTQILLKKAEEEIFNAYDDKKFLIDKNSFATNIDVLHEYFNSNRRSEKAKLQPAWLTPSENILNITGENAIFLGLLGRDINYSFKDVSLDELFDIVINMVEFIVLTIIITISVLWLFALLFWYSGFSLYLLPAMWLLGLLIYLLNSLKLKWIITKLTWFCVVVIIYWYWLTLLLNTFAL